MIKLLQPPCRALENMQTGPAARKVVDKVLLIRKKHIPVNWPRTVATPYPASRYSHPIQGGE